VRDAVGAADRLASRVASAVTTLLDEAPAPVSDVYVGWVAAADATECPARYRAAGEAGWGFPGWSAPMAAGAVARAALDRYLHDPDVAGIAGADRELPAPLELVRTWMRSATAGEPGVAGWVGDLRADRDGATMAATAAAAARWLAGFVRVIGWPLPVDMALLNVVRDDGPSGAARWWPAKGSAVTVASGADARLGKPRGSGAFALVVHRPSSSDDAAVHRRASFEAAAGALALHVAPAEVVVTAGDTGERARVVVDEDLLAAGGDVIVEVVRQRVRALTEGFSADDARPSTACDRCDEAFRCPPGQAWSSGSGRWRGGLPVLVRPPNSP
jgi:hypothetical protein